MAHQKGSATNSAVNFTEKYIDTIGEDTCDKDYVDILHQAWKKNYQVHRFFD